MFELLAESKILLLFTVITIGYLLGQIKIGKSKIGVVAVLFTGLIFGALSEDFQLPDLVFQLGLILFVYTIGLSSGPAFFNSYQQNGFRDFLFIAAATICTGVIAALVCFAFGFSAATISGIYAGSSTNTPALASVIEVINTLMTNAESAELSQSAVVAYSYAYITGILGAIAAIVLCENFFKIDYQKEKHKLRKIYPSENKLTSAAVKVSNKEISGKDIRSIRKLEELNIIFGRIKKENATELELADYNTKINVNDIITLIGNEEDLNEAINFLGEKTNNIIKNDKKKYDIRRIFVSNPDVVGRSIGSLNLKQKFDATITRIRRGDLEILATDNIDLELGDRIRFVAKREDLKTLSKYFGDSYQESSSVNLFSFGLGIALGLLLGTLKISLGEGFNFQLGFAGGPLVVGLLLGTLKRTGPVVWTLPYPAAVTLQQIGLVLLLTVIGVRSGNAFVSSFSLDGLVFVAAGMIIAFSSALIMLFVGYKILKLPFSLLIGMVSNQPAVYDFSLSRSGSRIPAFGYTTMFPIALIMKIIVAQLLFILLL